MSKKQMGFTLIEIVMVLVLLGILSAVAVPKYFDLRDKAEQKTAQALIAEIQARMNGGFADALLAGKACKGTDGARLAAIKEANTTKADGFTFEALKVEDVGGLKTVKVKSVNSEIEYAYFDRSDAANKNADSTKWIPQVSVPLCSGES